MPSPRSPEAPRTTLIAQLTDLHVRPVGVPVYQAVDTNAMTERALRAVAGLRSRPDAVIITGDLTDCGLEEEYALLAGMLARHLPDIPVYAVPGNHDRRERMIAGLPSTRHEEGFVQYAVEDLPVRLVMLDTVVPGAGHGELCRGRLDWLERTLAAEPRKPTVIGMHHPPFACGIAHMDRIALRDAWDFADLVAAHRQVERILCGHHHRPVVARVAHAVASIAPSVAHQVELDLHPDAATAFVLEPPAYQLHHWSAQHGFVTHTALVEPYPGPYLFIPDPDHPGRQP